MDPNEEPQQPQHPNPVPPAGGEPVPPAQNPLPPAQQPVPPAQYPAPEQPVHSYPPESAPVPQQPQQPVPPAQNPVPPHQPGSQTVQIIPGQSYPTEQAPIPPQQPVPGPPQINPTLAGAAASSAAARSHTRSRRPATARSRSSSSRSRSRPYRRPVKPVDSGVSVMTILLGILGVLMLVAAFMALLPNKAIERISGYPADAMTNREPKNLYAVGLGILETRTEDAVFTEKEVNDYLNFRLRGNQKGSLGGIMKVQGIYVDLRPKEAEIFVVRSFPIIGKTTMSSVVKSYFNEQKHQQIWKTGGGSIGKIKLKSKNLQPVLNAFLRMSKTGAQEIQLMNYMADVKIEEDKIILDSAL